jgi:hypothetical protein
VGAPTAYGVPNPNEKEPREDEFTFALERQLAANVGIRFTALYARTFNNEVLQNNLIPYDAYSIPVTKPDPGPTGIVGPSSPGTSVTYYQYASTLVGRQFLQGMIINDPNDDKTYKGVELGVSRRLSKGWQFAASYNVTKIDEPILTSAALTPWNPNSLINTANHTWEWLGKASGAYLFPAEVMVSANFERRSGGLWSRTVLFTGNTFGSITLPVEPYGAHRLPDTNLLDLRVEKRFHMVGKQTLALRMNLYNTLNINNTLSLTTQSGPAFGQPTSIVPARVLEFSASYVF